MLKIKEICKEKGITLKELAERLNITYQSLHTIMTGNPTIKTLEKIADVLGVNAWDLFEKEGNLLCPKCKKRGFSIQQTPIPDEDCEAHEISLCCNNCG